MGLKTLNHCLDLLQPYYNLPVCSLSEDVHRIYSSVQTIIQTSKDVHSGTKLLEILRDKFGNFDDLVVGSVAIHILGCLIQHHGDSNLFSSECISDKKPTGRKIVLCQKSHGSYHFKILYNTPSENVIIYLEDECFDGFTEKEKCKLRNFGCEIIQLICFDVEKNKYVNIYPCISIEEIKTRSSNIVVNDYNYGHLFLFLMIIALIIIILCWLFSIKTYYNPPLSTIMVNSPISSVE